MFSVQQLLEGLFSTQTFTPEELPELQEPRNPNQLEVEDARRLIALGDGKNFVAGAGNGKLYIFRTNTKGNASAVVDGTMNPALKNSFKALAPLGGSVFATGDEKALVTTWDARSKEPNATIELHSNQVSSIVALTEDSFLVGTATGHLGSFGHRNGRSLQEVAVVNDAHAGSVTALVAKNNLVVSASTDRTAKIWSLDELKPLSVLNHGHAVLAVDLNEHFIVTGCTEGEIRVYRNGDDYQLEKILRGLHGSGAVRSVTLLPDNIVMSTGTDGCVVFTDIFYQKPIERVQFSGPVYAASVLRDGRIVTCGKVAEVNQVFEPPTGLVELVKAHARNVFGVEENEVKEEPVKPKKKSAAKRLNHALKHIAHDIAAAARNPNVNA